MGISTQPAIRTKFCIIDGLSIRYAESSVGDIDALLLSPWPESLYAFEPTWSRLAEHAHLIAIDLPGFGHSEGRPNLFSPRAMGEFLVRIADAFHLDAPHVVGPDIGTGATLFMAALHPERISSAVIGSGGAAYPLQLGGVLKEWVEAPSLDPYRTMDPTKPVVSAMSSLERYTLSDAARQDYLTAYEGDRFVESMRYVRTYPTELPILADLLPRIQTPTQVITGDHDPAVPPVNGEFLCARLPRCTLDIIDAGHFTWEDAADEYARIVTNWWDANYRSAPRRADFQA